MDTVLNLGRSRRECTFECFVPNPFDRGDVVIADTKEQLILAPEVQVDCSLCNAGAFCDSVYGCRLVSVFGEDLGRGPKNGPGPTFGNPKRRLLHGAVPEKGFVVEVHNRAGFSRTVTILDLCFHSSLISPMDCSQFQELRG